MTLVEAIQVMTHRKHMLMMAELGHEASKVKWREIEAMQLLIETAEEKLRRTE